MKQKKTKETRFVMNVFNENYIRFEKDFYKLLKKYGVSIDLELERQKDISLRLWAFQDACCAVGDIIERETNKKEGEKLEYGKRLIWVVKRR